MLRATRPAPDTYREQGIWTSEVVGQALSELATTSPSSVALVDRLHSLTWGELHDLTSRAAAGLKASGLRAGGVVMAQLPNWWEAVVTIQAVMAQGAVVNPVVAIYREAEVGFMLHQARPSVVVIPHRFRGVDYVEMFTRLLEELAGPRPAIVVARPEGQLPDGFISFDSLLAGDAPPSELVSGSPSDIALLLYTSGTTAAPKGALHSHETLIYECRSIQNLFGLASGDHVFMASPLTHITGLLYAGLLPSLLGSTCVLQDVWDPEEAVELIEAHSCRFTVAATPFLSGLVSQYGSLGMESALRHFACGGADVPPDLVRQANAVLGADVVRIYGSTEFPTFCSGRPTDPVQVKASTDGYPIGPVECRLEGDPGGPTELLIRGPDLFLGYLDPALNEYAFTEDGYFRTGDLAEVAADGAVRIVGRAKDIIIRKGEKISAREVEDMLFQHPAIADVAVVAVPDADAGEIACAVLVLRPGHDDLGVAEISRFLDQFRVAKQKHPERVVSLGELPRTSSGKIQKYLLRQQLTRM